MNKYNKWIIDYRIQKRSNINERINKFQNIKGLIQAYIRLNEVKCINTKGMLEFIKPYNFIDNSSKLSTYYEIRYYLKCILNYLRSKTNARSLRSSLEEDIIVSKESWEKLIQAKFVFV